MIFGRQCPQNVRPQRLRPTVFQMEQRPAEVSSLVTGSQVSQVPNCSLHIDTMTLFHPEGAACFPFDLVNPLSSWASTSLLEGAATTLAGGRGSRPSACLWSCSVATQVEGLFLHLKLCPP